MYAICDSYVGCDQHVEVGIPMQIQPTTEQAHDTASPAKQGAKQGETGGRARLRGKQML